MSSSVVIANNPRVDAYRKYIESLLPVYPEFKWLSAFLGEPQDDPSKTRVIIADSSAGNIKLQDFTTDISGLSEALKNRPVKCKTRVILISYAQSWSVARDVIDLIGTTFNIDPQFYWSHFHHEKAHMDKNAPLWQHDTRTPTPPLASALTSVELTFDDEHLSALLLPGAAYEKAMCDQNEKPTSEYGIPSLPQIRDLLSNTRV
jgi:hypothetical protein